MTCPETPASPIARSSSNQRDEHVQFVVEKSDEGVSLGAPEKELGIKGSPTREV